MANRHFEGRCRREPLVVGTRHPRTGPSGWWPPGRVDRMPALLWWQGPVVFFYPLVFDLGVILGKFDCHLSRTDRCRVGRGRVEGVLMVLAGLVCGMAVLVGLVVGGVGVCGIAGGWSCCG